MASLEERLAAAERLIEVMAGLLTDVVETFAVHTVALQMVLQTKGVLTDEEVDARFRGLQDFATQELAHGDDPRYDRLRELRRLVEDADDSSEEEEDD